MITTRCSMWCKKSRDSSFVNIYFAYVIREAITYADVFARHGINLRVDSLLFPYVPDFVFASVKGDNLCMLVLMIIN